MTTNPRIAAAATNLATSSDVSVTGDRPTGPLHLGHYAGSIRSRLQLQQTCARQFVLVADLQALTDNSGDPMKVKENVLQVVADYLACGIDPRRSSICLQSAIPELAEITMLMMNLVPTNRLERNPTIRHEIEQRGFERGVPVGFLAYPVAQAADIVGLGGTVVPVGEDQLPIMETTNEIVASINGMLGDDVLPACRPILSGHGRLPGMDGRSKASKSSGNAISLSDSADDIRRKVLSMYTDPEHIRIDMPGKIEGNVVFAYMRAFMPEPEELRALEQHYRAGGLGDRRLKDRLTDIIESIVAPIRERRAELLADRKVLVESLVEGTNAARDQARISLDVLRRAFRIESVAAMLEREEQADLCDGRRINGDANRLEAV